MNKDVEIELDPIVLAKTPILCNKYVVGQHGGFSNKVPGTPPTILLISVGRFFVVFFLNARFYCFLKELLQEKQNDMLKHHQ